MNTITTPYTVTANLLRGHYTSGQMTGKLFLRHFSSSPFENINHKRLQRTTNKYAAERKIY